MVSHIILQMFSVYRALTGKDPIKCKISPIFVRELTSELAKGYLMANCVGSLTFHSPKPSEDESRSIGTFQGVRLIEDKNLLFGIQIIE